MKIAEKLRKELKVPQEYKNEFRERDYRYNNTAFLFAAALIFLLVFISFFTSRAALKDVSPQSYDTVWPVLSAMTAVTAVYIVWLVLRRKFTVKFIVCDIFDALFFIAAGALAAFLYYFMVKTAGADRPDIILIAVFFIVLFARFDLRITFGVLTAHFAMCLTVILMAGTQITIGIATAYILALYGAALLWIMRVKSFVNEKNFGALIVSDFLTDVRNRRGFDLTLEKAWENALKNGGRLTLYMIDIDNFKRYNDIYGHVEGDRCLKAVAGAIAEALRKGDCVARYGGEEFVVLLIDTQEEFERVIGARIQARVAAKEIRHRDSVTPFLTVSIGCANCCPAEGKFASPTEFVRIADETLYKAKESGRNRIIYHDDL